MDSHLVRRLELNLVISLVSSWEELKGSHLVTHLGNHWVM